MCKKMIENVRQKNARSVELKQSFGFLVSSEIPKAKRLDTTIIGVQSHLDSLNNLKRSELPMSYLMIDVDIIVDMTDEELHEYLPLKGDRVAVKVFASKKSSRTKSEQRKLDLIESLRCRNEKSLCDEDEDDTVTAPVRLKLKKRKSPFFSQNAKKFRQTKAASKDDRAVVVGFCMLEGDNKYHQVRSPLGGGIRQIRVEKHMKKSQLVAKITPLFFPQGHNGYGAEGDFRFDLSIDVHGNQLLLEDESVEHVMDRLGLKKFRCYLLAKVETLPKLKIKKRAKLNNDCDEEMPITSTCVTNDACDIDATDIGDFLDSDNASPVSMSVDEVSEVLGDNDHGCQVNDVFSPDPLKDDFEQMNIPSSFVREDILARALNESGVVQFGQLPPDGIKLDDTIPVGNNNAVKEIIVHRGLICKDLIDFFSKPENIGGTTTFEMKILRQDGVPELAEDNGGVMRDALSEFWDTFYVQYTEGNTYKVPVIRHDMGEAEWTAVGAVIKMGFVQESIFPIKLAPPFMIQSIAGSLIDSELQTSFLMFVSQMDKTVLQAALADFQSVEDEELYEVLGQFDVKKLVTSNNLSQVINEIAHKELIQKPMFVAECFRKVLETSLLATHDISAIYSECKATSRKVLSFLKFPDDMSNDEAHLSTYVKKFARELDETDLGLFLRFCTGADIFLRKEIFVRFISSDNSSNVRCPSARTCGCVLEIPRSYALDPYVSLKAEFLALLRSRYWQMDIV